MKRVETPFNPVLLPDLALPGAEPQPAKPEIKAPRKPSAPRKASRTARNRGALEFRPSPVRFVVKVRRKAKASWQRVKLGIATRLARLDREKVKRVLLACGITGTVAVLILALAKLTPLLIAILALLALGALVRLWDRLRNLPIPA